MKTNDDNVAGAMASGGVEARAQAALRSMETLRDMVDRRVAEMKTSPEWGQTGSDLEKIARDLSKAVLSSVELEGKVQDARRIEQGGDGLDLDAARSEIGRRLDLRLAAIGAAGVDGRLE